MKRAILVEIDENIILMPVEFDEALIGFVEKAGSRTVGLYDKEIVTDIFVSNGLDREEAMDWVVYNYLTFYENERCPAFATIWKRGEDL